MAGKSGGQSTTATSTKGTADDATWSTAEVAELRETLQGEIDRLTRELAEAQTDLVDLVQDTQDIVGDDQADVGSKAIEREHEAAMAANTRDVLAQYQHALERVDADLQGVCDEYASMPLLYAAGGLAKQPPQCVGTCEVNQGLRSSQAPPAACSTSSSRGSSCSWRGRARASRRTSRARWPRSPAAASAARSCG